MSLGLTQMITESKCGGNRPRCEAHGNQNHTEPRPEKEPPPPALNGGSGRPLPFAEVPEAGEPVAGARPESKFAKRMPPRTGAANCGAAVAAAAAVVLVIPGTRR